MRSRFLKISSLLAITGAMVLASAPAFAATTSTSSETAQTNLTSGTFSVSQDLAVFGSSGGGGSSLLVNQSLSGTGNGTGMVGFTAPGPGSGSPVFIVTDDTGTLAGWSLTIQGSPLTEVAPSAGFATGTSAIVLPVGTMQLSALSGFTPMSSQSASLDPTISSFSTPAALDSGTPITLATASSGTGSGTWGLYYSSTSIPFSEVFNLNSKIVDQTNYPGATTATPYSSTITVTLTQG